MQVDGFYAWWLWLRLLFPVVNLAGLVVCFRNRRLSPNMVLLILGFAGNLFFGTGVSILGNFFLPMVFPPAPLFFAVVPMGQLVCGFLEILGLALVFADVRRQLTRVRQADADTLRQGRMPDEEELRSWRARRQGSQDIQP